MEKGVSPFLTPVGMNRASALGRPATRTVPHTRGDEPLAELIASTVTYPFLTPVGMNREFGQFVGEVKTVPHTRGDEP